MGAKARFIHQAFENDRLVILFFIDGFTNNIDLLGTASSDGSIRSMVAAANGPPLAPSFLSSLVAAQPVAVLPPIPPPAVPASASHYTRAELDRVHFVHSLAILEHVICSKQTRQTLFPLIINNDKTSTCGSTNNQ